MSDLFSGGYNNEKFEYFGRMDEEIFDELLLWCSEHKVSDITLQSNSQVIVDIGGTLAKVTEKPLNQPEIEGIVRYIYGENGPAEIKSGHDLDPSHEVKSKHGRKRYRVNITGGRSGIGDGLQITIRTLPEIPPDINALGIEQDIIDHFRPKDGMVLVTGPTGSGKSTLLSAGIRMLIEKEDANEKILEYSKPIEYVYDKVDAPSSVVFQTEVGRHLRPRSSGHSDEESEFAHCVRNALRRKPTCILIGEARDKATISGAVEAALTGHALYTTMHTIGVAETLRRAVMPFPGDERQSIAIDIMETMRLAVTQILLPKVGGGKVGCREYMVFDPETRNIFLREHVDHWPNIARRLLSERQIRCRSMSDSAEILFNDNLITEQTFNYIASRGAVNDE